MPLSQNIMLANCIAYMVPFIFDLDLHTPNTNQFRVSSPTPSVPRVIQFELVYANLRDLTNKHHFISTGDLSPLTTFDLDLNPQKDNQYQVSSHIYICIQLPYTNQLSSKSAYKIVGLNPSGFFCVLGCFF